MSRFDHLKDFDFLFPTTFCVDLQDEESPLPRNDFCSSNSLSFNQGSPKFIDSSARSIKKEGTSEPGNEDIDKELEQIMQ